MNSPKVSKGQWIKIGTNGVDGYVIDILNDGSLAVGYYQNRNKAIKEEVIWNGSCWEFKNHDPNGTYLRGQEEAIVKRGPDLR